VELKSGESRTVNLELDRRAFSYYDVNTKARTLASGMFEILVSSSSEKIELKGSAMIGE
jgi:beta-glucosidase